MFSHEGCHNMRFRKGVGIALIAAAIATALGFVVMGLWNALLPGLFGFRTLHFWQALGLLALTRILFGGFHRRHHLIQRWESMTPEEREKFRAGFRRCGCAGRAEPQA